jgi:hypothetical protein
MMAAVVKVQLPLAPDNSVQPGEPALVYDRTRLWHFRAVVDDALRAKMGGKVKGFFYALRHADGRIELGREAPWQEW